MSLVLSAHECINYHHTIRWDFVRDRIASACVHPYPAFNNQVSHAYQLLGGLYYGLYQLKPYTKPLVLSFQELSLVNKI